jgi:hypothetical protein
MKVVLFEVYYEGGKDQIHIDSKYSPKIETYTDNSCAIIGRLEGAFYPNKIFARFGINHSVVCKGEVLIESGFEDAHENTYKY